MTEPSTPLPSIAVLGGTGKEGKGLAYRWAKAGHRVLIGSRSPEKAQATTAEIYALLKSRSYQVEGIGNVEAARQADIVVLTVPYSAHQATLETVKEAVQGKILVDVTVPLVPPKVSKVQMPPAGSAAQEARQIVGDGVEVAAAFQNISYEHLLNDGGEVECDVLVVGTSKAVRA
ncbi:MAG TPA: NADPH-dependent F420 reductase, partial [Anaerolineales bacterium]